MHKSERLGVGKAGQEVVADGKLIVHGLPSFVTEAMLLDAFKGNKHVLSAKIIASTNDRDSFATGTVRHTHHAEMRFMNFSFFHGLRRNPLSVRCGLGRFFLIH